MRAQTIALLLSSALCFQSPVLAEVTERGTGLAYGKEHAYFLTAPPGWMLDTESGAAQGVFAVFYPRGSSWNGPVAMYSNAAPREGLAPEAAINRDVESMREKSPKIKVTDGGIIPTGDKKNAFVRYFTNDNWGNSEAAAYVMENKTVVNIILTARDKASFDQSVPAFKQLVGSYRFITEEPDKVDLNALARAEAKRNVPHEPESSSNKESANSRQNAEDTKNKVDNQKDPFESR